MTLAARLIGKTAAETISVMLAVFDRIVPTLRKSITFDNDMAFAQHALLRTMRAMTTWFCDAYASWQKGGGENAKGRLRRWLPRHIDIEVSDEEIQDIVLTANLTPRKCLGYKTPFQAILKELGKEVWASAPHEGLGVGVGFCDKAIDRGLKFRDGSEYAAFEALVCELGEESFDGVEP